VRFFAPTTEEEALSLLDSFAGRASILAGGTDLLVRIRRENVFPEAAISLGNLPWTEVAIAARVVRIGAMATATMLHRQLVNHVPALSSAAAQIGGAQIRNMATVGGNIANASPAADMALTLLALDADVKIVSPNGPRDVPLRKLLRGPGETSLRPTEVIRAISVPVAPSSERHWFRKIGPRSRHFISRVSLAGTVEPRANSGYRVRLALGAVAPTPVRARAAEEYLQSVATLGRREIDTAARLAAEDDCAPIDDFRGTARYRRTVVRNLVTQFLNETANSDER
jgi:carbon-monoxide dehydrogenase medium subunit